MKFVRNAWYVAALVSELGDAPFARTILSMPIVLFRTASGKVHALLDICPHRAVPLHRGEVVGERIRCAYHGLEFDAEGVCRHNPHVKSMPERLKGQSFPLVERYGLYWIWPGDPQLADTALLPDYAFFDTAVPTSVGRGYTRVVADYRLMLDNLFDLSHAEYIHPESVGIRGAHAVAQYKVERGDNWVRFHYDIPDMPPAAIWRAAWNKSAHMDQHAHMTWSGGGGSCYLDLCITPPGQPSSEGWNLPFLHLLTPETERSTHYFWAFARDFDVDNVALTQAAIAISIKAFDDEDRPMIESSQQRIESCDARLRNFNVGDHASLLIRRQIDALIESERQAASGTAPAAESSALPATSERA